MSGSGAALREAAAVGDVTQVYRLLGPSRCVRFTRDELGRSALHLAASAGHGPVVRTLLAAAAPREVDSPDGAGCTALQRAAADGHEEVVRLLLARGADVDRQDTVHGNSALHEAAWKGYSRTVALLASAGADLARANAGGFAALHLCCQNGHNQSCREILLAGCDPDLQNNYGDTALHTAARYGHAGVTRILISAQCRVSEQNKNGDTALHIAAAMGRRKLTRILLEAGCDKNVRNKQNETARDIALRKDLNEILVILDEVKAGKEKDRKRDKGKSSSGGGGGGSSGAKKSSGRTKSSKVRFDAVDGGGGGGGSASKSNSKQSTANKQQTSEWSPYGCHYYPDPEAFPQPRLDSLPTEPLKKGEQYYLDLAGNIRKGPVGVGYTCYCAPLFRHLEAKIERDKRELQRAQVRLGQRVAGLEQKITRGIQGRRSERAPPPPPAAVQLPRSRSLEMLENADKPSLSVCRSMNELEESEQPRRSVAELVARIQQVGSQLPHASPGGDGCSESSDDEDSPLRSLPRRGPMMDSNLAAPNYENVPNGGTATMMAAARSRLGVYSPAAVGDVAARIAKMRLLDGGNAGLTEIGGDRDTNNDSGYSTKVYGSSKGNSPSLSGQMDGECCLGASSLV